MIRSGSAQSHSRISGQLIIGELIRNMELGRLELAYSIVLPCLFSVYLHPDDYAWLRGVQSLIKEDAKRALNTRLNDLNRRSSLFHRSRTKKVAKIAQGDWWIELFADTEGAVPPGDIEIHSELNDVAQPGYRGIKTTLIEREPSVTAARVIRDRDSTRKLSTSAYARIRYQDDSGPQTYFVTQNEISIGRGGDDLWVDLPLYTNEEVSREHVRLRRDPSGGGFTILDESRNGTWLNGRRLERGMPEPLPDHAEIGIAEVLQLSFDTLG
jgi:hypothetical protein